MQRRSCLTKCVTLSPLLPCAASPSLHAPPSLSSLYCSTASLPSLHCFTAPLSLLHSPLLHCCHCLPRSYVQHMVNLRRGSPDSCAASPMLNKVRYPVALTPHVQCCRRFTLLLHCRHFTASLLHCRCSTLGCFIAVTACLAPTYSTKKRW